jgi:hypothetical protein
MFDTSLTVFVHHSPIGCTYVAIDEYRVRSDKSLDADKHDIIYELEFPPRPAAIVELNQIE